MRRTKLLKRSWNFNPYLHVNVSGAVVAAFSTALLNPATPGSHPFGIALILSGIAAVGFYRRIRIFPETKTIAFAYGIWPLVNWRQGNLKSLESIAIGSQMIKGRVFTLILKTSEKEIVCLRDGLSVIEEAAELAAALQVPLEVRKGFGKVAGKEGYEALVRSLAKLGNAKPDIVDFDDSGLLLQRAP